MIELTDKPIDVAAVEQAVRSPAAGAVVLFLGTARDETDGRRTSSLEYECYPEMARDKLSELERDARVRWPLVDCAIVHRLGKLAVGETSVVIAVSSAHRQPAFEAGQWLIDRIKEVVPIWKKEHWADGTSEWVHPGLARAEPVTPKDLQTCAHAADKLRRRTSKAPAAGQGDRQRPSTSGPLTDRFGRVHTDLRISVTDRCNLRCRYCMPAEGVPFRPHDEILSFEEIHRFVRVAAGLGIREVRLTGGEPLVRKQIGRLVEMIASVPGIDDLAMTTNGILLDRYAQTLRDAGLDRLNISLDTLDRAKFERISRHDELPRVLEGIAAAKRAGFRRIKLNALAIRGQIEEDVVPLARFAREHDVELRFIEFMPLDGDRRWQASQVLCGEEIVSLLAETFGSLEPVADNGSHGPATEYRFRDGGGRIGVIPTVSKPFCDRCSRVRLTAEGNVHACLFSSQGWDARALLRSGASDQQLADLIRRAVHAKKEARASDDGAFPRPERTMHQIGG